MLSILFEYLIWALESFNCFEQVLSRLLIKNLYFASYESLAYKEINKLYQHLDPDLWD